MVWATHRVRKINAIPGYFFLKFIKFAFKLLCILPIRWEERWTPAGRVQYINKLTRAVQWDKPTRSAYDAGSEGRSTIVIPTATLGAQLHGETSPEHSRQSRLITQTDGSKLNSSFVFKGVNENFVRKNDEIPNLKTKTKSNNKRISLNPETKSFEQSNTSGSPPRGAMAARVPDSTDRQRYYMDRNLIHRVTSENFDRKTTSQGQVYFVNRITGQTTWNDPSLPIATSVVVVQELGALPDGWETRTTQSGKRYFVDHNTRTTQFAGTI